MTSPTANANRALRNVTQLTLRTGNRDAIFHDPGRKREDPGAEGRGPLRTLGNWDSYPKWFPGSRPQCPAHAAEYPHIHRSCG